MNAEPIHYNYVALFQGVVWLVLAAGLVIVAIQFKWLPRGSKWLAGWLREKRGDVLAVLFLFGSAGIGWLGVWVWWIVTHVPE